MLRIAAFCLSILSFWTSSFAEVSRAQVDAALPKLERLAERTMRRMNLPGMAIAVVHNDEIVYLKGFGVRKVGASAKINPDTVFMLASVSKPIASSLVAALVGDGIVRWNDPVVKHDPGFRLRSSFLSRRVTIRDFFSHRSGLPDHAGDLLEDLGFDRSEILYRLRYYPVGPKFRSHYAYTNFGLTEGAIAAAKAAGTNWETLSQNRLYRPLKMHRTSSRYSDYANTANRAHLHVPNNAELVPNGRWVARYERDPEAQSPAGGVSSTARDLCNWMRMQLDGGKFEGRQIVQNHALKETHRPQIITSYNPDTGKTGAYGLGWNVDTDDDRVFWRHSGAFALGARTQVSLCPSENLGIAVLVNAGSNGVPEGMTFSFYDFVLFGALRRDWMTFAEDYFVRQVEEDMAGDGTNYRRKPANPTPPQPLSNYEGRYENTVYGPLEVRRENGKLVLILGPDKVHFPLTHYNGDTFYFVTKGEMQTGTGGAVFQGSRKRGIDSVILRAYDKEGLGKFTRE